MAVVIVRHKVKDFNSWKKTFDEFIETRRAGGETTYQVLHMDDDPNNILLIAGWDNKDNARKFFTDPALKETMGKAGVVEQPDIFYLEEYYQGKT